MNEIYPSGNLPALVADATHALACGWPCENRTGDLRLSEAIDTDVRKTQRQPSDLTKMVRQAIIAGRNC